MRRGRVTINCAARVQKRLGLEMLSRCGQKARGPPMAISAGVRVSPATSVTATATAIAGPVVEKSATLAVVMAMPPTITVPAELAIASPTRWEVVAMAWLVALSHLLAEAADQEDAVVGARAEDDGQDERLRERRHLDEVQPEEGDDRPHHHDRDPDRRQRDDRRDRRAVDHQQDDDQQHQRDHRGLADALLDAVLEVGDDGGGAGDVAGQVGRLARLDEVTQPGPVGIALWRADNVAQGQLGCRRPCRPC